MSPARAPKARTPKQRLATARECMRAARAVLSKETSGNMLIELSNIRKSLRLIATGAQEAIEVLEEDAG